VTSETVVSKAKELVSEGNIGIAYTYNEPTIWYEFVYDTAVLAKEEGLSNVLVTNGFIGREALLMLLPYIDAMNIDVKAYTASFYKIYAGCFGECERNCGAGGRKMPCGSNHPCYSHIE